MFEHFEEFELAAAQVRHFREKFDIGYHTLIAGISDKTEAAKVLPSLSAVLAYPTTLFIDRNGRQPNDIISDLNRTGGNNAIIRCCE